MKAKESTTRIVAVKLKECTPTPRVFALVALVHLLAQHFTNMSKVQREQHAMAQAALQRQAMHLITDISKIHPQQ
jgi:hypothetical protein